MQRLSLTPSLASACKISGLKSAHIHACQQYIYDGLITNLLLIQCVLIGIHLRVQAKGKKALMISDLTLLLVVFRETARQPWQ